MEPDPSQIEPDTLGLSAQQLERELARTREELQAMQALLEDLPSVFENKFRQRLQPLLEQQQRLLSENTVLRQHLHQLQPGVGAAPHQPVLLPQQQERPRLRRALRHAIGLADQSQLDQSQPDQRSAA